MWSEWLASIRSAMVDLSEAVSAYLPRVVAALVLLAVGWLLARLLGAVVRQVVHRLEAMVRSRTGVEETRGQRAASQLVSGITFWVVFLFFVATATERLGLRVVTEAVSRLAGYLPAALGCVLILLAASLVADFAQRRVVSFATGRSYAELLGRATKVLILVVAGILALDQLGVENTVLIALVTILSGTALGGAALAFALGARTTVSNILASHYLLQNYRPGQTIQVASFTGRIVDIKPSGVVLDAAEGQVLVPASTFSESISIRLPDERS